MEKLINNKKYLTFILIGLLTMVIGISLSFIMFDLSGGDNSIQTGQISMNYIEPSNEVVLKDQLPISDELGMHQDKYFEFSVMSNATTSEFDKNGVNIFYEISLLKKDVDEIYNQLEDKDIKIYLTKVVGEEESVVVGPILISELEKSNYGDSLKIYDTKNKHHSNNGSITTKYRLRFWIDNDVNASDWYLKNKYEYRFAINVNGHAPNLDLINDNTLATKIKTMYTVENGAAVEENGYYYLKGTETLNISNNSSSKVLSLFGELGNIYLYRNEDNFYNQELLEHDIRNYLILSGIPEEEYNRIAESFGGYVSALLGAYAGVVDMNSMTYIDGYTINDIPSLDEAMLDETMKSSVIDLFSEMITVVLVYNESSFMKMYSDGKKINQELLNANLKLGMIAMDNSNMISIIETNFGSLSNYCVAEVYELAEDVDLVEGKTIEDIPSLENVFVYKDEKPLLTNTYVKLNGILWKVMGINKDDTIKLMSVSPINFVEIPYMHGMKYTQTDIVKYLGYNEYEKSSSFLKLIKGSTLEELIIKTEYEYEEDGKKEKVLAYASMPTYEEVVNSMVGNYTYLASFGEYDITVAKTDVYFKHFYNDYDGLTEVECSSSNNVPAVRPVITIKNIDVLGDGTKNNPYVLSNEVVVDAQDVAESIQDTLLFYDVNATDLYLYNDADFSFNPEKTGVNEYGEMIFYSYPANSPPLLKHSLITKYSAGISIKDVCYYKTIDGVLKEINYSGNCSDKFVSINSNNYNRIDTYSYNETKFTVFANNATSYQWQQRIGDKWVDLEDYSGRINGSKTNELKIIPTSYFNEYSYFRCIVENDVSMKMTSIMIMHLVLTDGEWVYEEIDDTNKYQVISYIGDYATSPYFSLLDNSTNYHLDFPSTINGDIIEVIESVTTSTDIGKSTWEDVGAVLTSVEIPGNIKVFNALVRYHASYSKINEIKFNEGLIEIGDGAFRHVRLKEVNMPDSLKIIGYGAFDDSSYIEKIKFGNGLVSIGDASFRDARIKELIIPDSVQFIGYQAFESARLTKLKIPSNVETIGSSAFHYSSLAELEIPSSVDTIGSYAFYKSNLTKLVLNEGLKTIGESAFYNARLTELVIPNTVNEIGNSAFISSPLESLVLSENLSVINHAVFENSRLTSLEIPKSVRIIKRGAFKSSPLTKLVLHEGIEQIGVYDSSSFSSLPGAFEDALLTELNIPSSVSNIGYDTFKSSRFKDLKIYGKTSLNDFETLGANAITMVDGCEPQFIEGALG